MDENLTTGLLWILDKNACSQTMVKIESTYDAPDQFDYEAEIAGEGGTRYFSLTGGVDTGDCTFRMAYARPWEFNWEDSIDN